MNKDEVAVGGGAGMLVAAITQNPLFSVLVAMIASLLPLIVRAIGVTLQMYIARREEELKKLRGRPDDTGDT